MQKQQAARGFVISIVFAIVALIVGVLSQLAQIIRPIHRSDDRQQLLIQVGFRRAPDGTKFDQRPFVFDLGIHDLRDPAGIAEPLETEARLFRQKAQPLDGIQIVIHADSEIQTGIVQRIIRDCSRAGFSQFKLLVVPTLLAPNGHRTGRPIPLHLVSNEIKKFETCNTALRIHVTSDNEGLVGQVSIGENDWRGVQAIRELNKTVTALASGVGNAAEQSTNLTHFRQMAEVRIIVADPNLRIDCLAEIVEACRTGMHPQTNQPVRLIQEIGLEEFPLANKDHSE